MKSMNPIRCLTDDEIWAAISYLEGDLGNKQFNASAALAVLLIGILISFLTLVWHVSNG
jgi:hypothetical protein